MIAELFLSTIRLTALSVGIGSRGAAVFLWSSLVRVEGQHGSLGRSEPSGASFVD
jgi:hypothetical protein